MRIFSLPFGLVRVTTFLIAAFVAAPAMAGGLSDVFRKELGGLELEPLGSALAKTVASTYPVASASSSIAYTFDPATESFERQTLVLGPIIGERAETIGKGRVDASLSYSYVNLTSINGQSLGSLTNKPSINGRVVAFPVPDGVILADGRFSNFVPVRVDADIGVDAHLITPGVTYGITADWDVNLTLPVVRSSIDVDAKVQVPDPRLPQFALPADNPNNQTRKISSSDDSVGIGDVLLRTKYMLHRGAVADVAAFLGISAPSGDQDDFQGTGDWEVQPSLIVSRVFADRVEPLVNVGIDIDADDVDRSVVRWGAGATGQLNDQLSLAMIFFGRHELDSQANEIDAPFFFQIERNDQIDLSVGLRYFLLERAVIAANFLVPLNEEGLRADFIPTLQLEYAF